jgi:2-oxoglutarate ferredoxin oxidoreductase subunit beta
MVTLQKKDYASDRQVKWCPGCGDYAILSSLQNVLAKLALPKENVVFISGIGCAGRLPYYLSTFGFHTIHGRAPAFATGLKLARPELSVWVVVGDGDGLSIGANQLLHLLRRNINVNVLLINNQIYGLTKGQFSPTSEKGKLTGTSPQGVLENPINPIMFALSAGASFVARAIDTDKENLENVLFEAHQHQGVSFVEILQNCHVFNDGAFEKIRNAKTRPDHAVYLNNLSPLVFGHDKNQVICMENYAPTVKSMENTHKNIIEYDQENTNLALMLSQLTSPLPLGVFKKANQDVYDQHFIKHQDNYSNLQQKYHALLNQ